MPMRPITANPSQIIVEQLAASGVKYVFNNSGSREARFFDAPHAHPDIHGILVLHEGSVAAMAGGYAQVKLDVAGHFGRTEGTAMQRTGEFPGVVLDGADPVKIAEGFGVASMHVTDESRLSEAITFGLELVQGKGQPFLLNVHLPLGLPKGGCAAAPFHLTDGFRKA